MNNEIKTVLMARIPTLYAAALNADAHAATVAMRRLLADLRVHAPEVADGLKAALPSGGSNHVLRALHSQDEEDEAPGGDLLRVAPRSGLIPILNARQRQTLDDFLAEQEAAERLLAANLQPRRTAFFVGPPGVGKTMMAGWVAERLQLPLYTVQLASLMSSYLGRTGQNLRAVLDFARSHRAVVLLDEFDAIGKRRDDPSDHGELRRVVSVALKEIEEWPGPSILIAATNHPSLIDPAIFRRFQLHIEVAPPESEQVTEILALHLHPQNVAPAVLQFAATILAGSSGSGIRDVSLEARRLVALGQQPSIEEALLHVVARLVKTQAERKRFVTLAKTIMRKRRPSLADLASLLGVSKSTIHNDLA